MYIHLKIFIFQQDIGYPLSRYHCNPFFALILHMEKSMLAVHFVFYWLPDHVTCYKSPNNTNKSQQLVDCNMHPVSISQLNYILPLLDSGHLANDITPLIGLHHTIISIIFRKNCPDLQNVPSEYPSKLFEADIHYA